MSAKKVIFDNDVRSALQSGVAYVANAVRVTIGPRGRNVAIDKSFGGPRITNDGVSIAKEIELKDKFKNMGAQVLCSRGCDSVCNCAGPCGCASACICRVWPRLL